MKDVYIQKNTTEEESKVKSVENLILVSLCSLLYFIFFFKKKHFLWNFKFDHHQDNHLVCLGTKRNINSNDCLLEVFSPEFCAGVRHHTYERIMRTFLSIFSSYFFIKLSSISVRDHELRVKSQQHTTESLRLDYSFIVAY